jgi:hypothetical protein
LAFGNAPSPHGKNSAALNARAVPRKKIIRFYLVNIATAFWANNSDHFSGSVFGLAGAASAR